MRAATMDDVDRKYLETLFREGLDSVRAELREGLDSVRTELRDGFERVDERMLDFNERLHGFDLALGQIDRRVSVLEIDVSNLRRRLDDSGNNGRP